MGIAIVSFAGDEDGGAIPAAGGHLRVLAVTDDLVSVVLTREEGFDILVETTTAVVADVDDDTLLLIVLAHDIGVDRAEAGITHRGDVDVAECALRYALYLFGTLLDPALVEEVIEGRGGDGADDFVDLLTRGGAEGDEEALAYLIIQQGEVVLACLELLAVDGGDDATLLQLRAGVVEGTTCDDFIDVQSAGASYGRDEDAELSRGEGR